MPEADKGAAQSALPDARLTSQGAISDEALRKAEEFVEQEEGAANRLTGMAGTVVTVAGGFPQPARQIAADRNMASGFAIPCPAPISRSAS